jgi:hypothetical protein
MTEKDSTATESWPLKIFKETCCDGCLCKSDKDHQD